MVDVRPPEFVSAVDNGQGTRVLVAEDVGQRQGTVCQCLGCSWGGNCALVSALNSDHRRESVNDPGIELFALAFVERLQDLLDAQDLVVGALVG